MRLLRRLVVVAAIFIAVVFAAVLAVLVVAAVLSLLVVLITVLFVFHNFSPYFFKTLFIA